MKSISFIFLSSCKSIDFIILFFFGKLFLYVPFRLKNTWTAAYDSSVKKLSSYFLKKCILRRNLLTGNIFWYNLWIPREKSLKKIISLRSKDYQKISEIEKNIFIFRKVLNIYYNEYLNRMIITRLQYMNK